MSNPALVEVTATFYQKGDEINSPDEDHVIWLKPLDENNLEDNPRLAKDNPPIPEGQQRAIWTVDDHPKDFVFVDDNIGFDLKIIGSSPEPGYLSNLEIEIEQLGMEEIFRNYVNYVEDFAKIGDILRQSPTPTPEKKAGFTSGSSRSARSVREPRPRR